MKSVIKFLRIPEWYDSKLPMSLSVMLYFFIIFPPEDVQYSVWNLLLFFIFLFFYLAFGYVINDFSDMDADRIVGKEKLITKIPKSLSLSIIILLVIVSSLPLCLASNFDYKIIIILIVNYLFGASYSAKPFRFKARGLWGLIISSAAQRSIPLLVIPVLYEVSVLLFIGWVIISFLNGLRYILIHQHRDYDADLKSEINTFATKHQKSKILEILIYLCLTGELIIVFFLLLPLIISHPIIVAVILLYAVTAIVAIWSVSYYLRKSVFLTYTYVPLEDFFNVLLPLSFAVLLMVQTQSLWYLFVSVALLLYLLPTIINKYTIIFLPIRIKMARAKFVGKNEKSG